jgi:hypothetical protein
MLVAFNANSRSIVCGTGRWPLSNLDEALTRFCRFWLFDG